jgi:hypothetical protein
MKNYNVYEGESVYNELARNKDIKVGDTISFITHNQQGYMKYKVVLEDDGTKDLEVIEDYDDLYNNDEEEEESVLGKRSNDDEDESTSLTKRRYQDSDKKGGKRKTHKRRKSNKKVGKRKTHKRRKSSNKKRKRSHKK